MQAILPKILLLVLAYIAGSISPSFFIAKIFYGFDIRTRGSNNPGTTNAFRTMGKKAGIATLVIDLIKGVIPTYIGLKLYGKDFGALAATFAILGHNYPFYLGFKGGKGVATSMGTIFVVSPAIASVSIAIGLLVLVIFKIMSLASITGFFIFSIIAIYNLLMGGQVFINILYLLIGLHGIYRHRSNIERIIQGNENKIGKKM